MLLQMKRINPYLHSDEPVQRNAQILQWIQVSLMVLLLMALFVVLLAQQGDRRTLYIVMITGFLLLLGFMMKPHRFLRTVIRAYRRFAVDGAVVVCISGSIGRKK